MNKITSLLMICTALAVLKVQAYNNKDHTRIVLFDKEWKFHLGHASDPSMDFNYRIASIYSKTGKAENSAIDPKFEDKDWESINLPHDWAVGLPFVNSANFDVQSHGYKPVGGLFAETSIGWYRKHFTVSEADSGQRFSIRFDGVFRDAKIWLNGFYLGNNESGYIGMTYDITDYIRFDADNVIIVRVDATQYEGWFYEGAGIYRHVWLIQQNNLHLNEGDCFIYSDVKEKNAVIHVEAAISNDDLVPVDGDFVFYVSDRNGNVLSKTREQNFKIDTRNRAAISQSLTINDVKLWSPTHPYLYRAILVLKSGGKVTDSLKIRFGVRSLKFDSQKGFFLNGENIKILGVCCHQDHAGVGAALPDYLQYYRVELLKEMGVNAYRTSHNAPTPELLDACDSLGMLVLDEQRLLNSSPEYMDQFERLIKRDRNHPSVFMWSIGNEEGYVQTNGNGKRISQSLINKQMKLDPTRTCTYGADLPNIFNGINEVIPIRGFNYRQFAIADYHLSHPDQPIIGTEMGSTVTTRGIYEKDTVLCYLPDQDITAPWWASTAEEWWSLCASQPSWMGGFVWTGFDYRGEPTPFRWPNISSHFGIMDVCGFPKNIYYFYQSWWTNKDILHISPHWNHKGMEGQKIRVWVNSNTDTVELILNDKSIGRKENPKNSHLEWMVPYETGKLEAIGYKNGKKLRTKVETTGDPVKIGLSSSKQSIIADQQDATVINVTVMDAEGREVPDASNLIHFTLKGDTKIIGVGNGDPSSHEADKCKDNNWQRRLFNGKCQVILQAGKTGGFSELEARSEGMAPGVIRIEATNNKH